MNFTALLEGFAQRVGLPNVVPTKEGSCAVMIDKDMVVHLETDRDAATVFLSSPVCRIPDEAENRLALFDILLQAHGFGIQTLDSYFAANAATREVILCKRAALEYLDGESFYQMVNTFVQVLKAWRDKAAHGEFLETSASSSGQIPSGNRGQWA